MKSIIFSKDLQYLSIEKAAEKTTKIRFRGNARESQILAIGSLFFESLRLKKLHIG